MDILINETKYDQIALSFLLFDFNLSGTIEYEEFHESLKEIMSFWNHLTGNQTVVDEEYVVYLFNKLKSDSKTKDDRDCISFVSYRDAILNETGSSVWTIHPIDWYEFFNDGGARIWAQFAAERREE